MLENSYLAFDLGAESGRAVLGTLAGGRLESREIHRFPNIPIRIDDRLHWNVPGLLAEMKAAMKACAARAAEQDEAGGPAGHAGPDGARERGADADGPGPVSRGERSRGRHRSGGPISLGVDTWGVDFGLLDGAGELVDLPVCYRDERILGAMEEYFRLVPREAIYAATGVQFLPFNTLYQVYSLVRDRSPRLAAATDLLFMPDLFNYLLTGRKAAEFTIATTSQLYDPRTKGWARGLFQAMGFSRGVLREIVPPGTVLGPLRPEIAAETGLEGVRVVATAGHDTAAAVAAVPAESGRDDWAYISSGTWSLVGIETREPLITERTLAGNFTNEGGVGGANLFHRNVAGLWLLQQCRKSWSKQRLLGYDEMTRLGADAPPFGAMIDPDAPDFLNPDDMPGAIAMWCTRTGQRAPATGGELVRAILESLALKYRFVLDRIEEVSGRKIRTVHVIGGGSRNRLLDQFTADASGRTVIAGPAEATAMGNLLVQAAAMGRVDSPARIRDIVRASVDLETFTPSGDPAWEAAYERFRNLI